MYTKTLTAAVKADKVSAAAQTADSATVQLDIGDERGRAIGIRATDRPLEIIVPRTKTISTSASNITAQLSNSRYSATKQHLYSIYYLRLKIYVNKGTRRKELILYCYKQLWYISNSNDIYKLYIITVNI